MSENSDAMSAEFDTVASWTAEAARELGPDYFVPAGCRGSGGPGAMDWLLDRLPVGSDRWLLDVGAGVGGPAGYAAERHGSSPLLVEPEPGACRAAHTLFGFPTVCGDAAALPIGSGAVEAIWCLGVLCTTSDHAGVLRELGRVLGPGGRIGLLVYVAAQSLHEQPEGNNFPLRDDLPALYRAAGLECVGRALLDDMPADDEDWTRRQDAVRHRVRTRHEHEPAWQEAAAQEKEMGRLLGSGDVVGELAILRQDGSGTGKTPKHPSAER